MQRGARCVRAASYIGKGTPTRPRLSPQGAAARSQPRCARAVPEARRRSPRFPEPALAPVAAPRRVVLSRSVSFSFYTLSPSLQLYITVPGLAQSTRSLLSPAAFF